MIFQFHKPPLLSGPNADHLGYLRMLFALNVDFDLSPHVKIIRAFRRRNF